MASQSKCREFESRYGQEEFFFCKSRFRSLQLEEVNANEINHDIHLANTMFQIKQWLLSTYMLKIARRGLIGDFLTMFKIQTQTVILLCEQVFTIFLCIGEYALIEIISSKITRCKLTEVTGPLFPLEI